MVTPRETHLLNRSGDFTNLAKLLVERANPDKVQFFLEHDDWCGVEADSGNMSNLAKVAYELLNQKAKL
jgi:hypothetical protein